MKIRNAQESDLTSIQKICGTAFSDEENQLIIEFATNLLSELTSPPIQSLVAELDNKVIGFVSFSPIFMSSEHNLTGYILAPLAVLPDHQKKGVGSTLINEGKQILLDSEVDLLLVYGDPSYYGRFGFKEEVARLFLPPYPLKYQFGWQALILSDCKIGNTPMHFECVSSLNNPSLW